MINAIKRLKPVLNNVPQNERKTLIYSKAASKVLYGAELLIGQNQRTLKSFTSVLMICNRSILKQNTFKLENDVICRKPE